MKRSCKQMNGCLGRFRHDESGATLVELAIALPLFLVLFFGMLDFGRMAYRYVAAEKAMQVAARITAVRPAACAGVPQSIVRGTATLLPPARFGTSCSSIANVCAQVSATCNGSTTSPTAVEIWSRVSGVLPNDATIANLQFRYDADNRLGFLGGPYTPVVTVSLQNLNFAFVTPLGALAALASSTQSTGLGSAAIPFPPISVSLPGEDLALGDDG